MREKNTEGAKSVRLSEDNQRRIAAIREAIEAKHQPVSAAWVANLALAKGLSVVEKEFGLIK